MPETNSLAKVAAAAKKYTACPLYKKATETVFGEGPKHTTIVMIGEQPGDYEDVAGKPFVGPAGKILDRALEEADIDRGEVYVTNAVKHFKWEPRGKRRIHQKPSARDIAACRPWMEAELRLVEPRLVVCLGSTAGQAIFGPGFRVTKERGKNTRVALCQESYRNSAPIIALETAGRRIARTRIQPFRLRFTPGGKSSEREMKFKERRSPDRRFVIRRLGSRRSLSLS